MHENRHGFALPELIVVALILVALTTITIPAFANFIDTTKEQQYIMEAQGVRHSIELYLIDHYDEEIDAMVLLANLTSRKLCSPKHMLSDYMVVTCTEGAYIEGLTVDTQSRVIVGLIYRVDGYRIEIDGENATITKISLQWLHFHYQNSNFPKAGTSSPTFDGSNISNTSMILYKISDANWAGVGCNGQGKPILRLGTSENYKAVYRFDMDGLYFNNTNIIASEKKNATGLNGFTIGGDYYVRKYSNGLGVAVFTNIIIPQITTNGWIEMVRLPFTMRENAAFRVNLSRGGVHAGIRDAIFTGTVLSAYLTTADSGAEISINAAINLIL